MINSKHRTKLTVNFEEPDRVPFQLVLDEEISPKIPKIYRKEIEVLDEEHDYKMFEDVNYLSMKLFDMDIAMIFPTLDFPQPEINHSDGRDWLPKPLIDDLKNMDKIILPDPKDLKAYEEFNKIETHYKDKYIMGSIPGVLYYYHSFRGYQDMMTDIIDYPEKYDELAEKIAKIQQETVKMMCNFKIDALFIGDDICGRTGLMMSPKHLDEFVWKYNKRIIDEGTKRNIPVFYHSDGDTTDILDKLVKIGVRGINPVQYHLHDLKKLKKRYGKNLVFFGCLDNSFILRSGNIKEVEKHVLEVFEIMGPKGGLILSPSSISYTTPKENILTMVNTIKNKCFYKK